MADGGNPLWEFSWWLYHQPGVGDACLALQDRRGLDVNLLLACVWAGRQGRALSEADIAGLIDAAGDWQRQVVKPLRSTRRWLKHQTAAPPEPAEALRQEVKAQEIEAERLEQAILYSVLGGQGAPVDAEAPAVAGADNLRRLLARLNADPDPDDRAHLVHILHAAFGAEMSPLRLLWRLEGAE